MMYWCNFLHGGSVCVAVSMTLWSVPLPELSLFMGQPVGDGPRTEPEWVDYIAVQDFGLAEVDGKVEGVEVSLFNGKRVDLVWNGYAIEADWANKAPEGIGQSLYYAAVTHRKPGLLLLLKKSSDVRYVEQALVVCRRNTPEIRVWAYDTKAKKFLQVSDKPRQ
jgi:hypothetical protein